MTDEKPTDEKPVSRIKAFHVADAYEAVARVNHYLVTLDRSQFTAAERDYAKQLLIAKQNAGPQQGLKYLTLERALDLIAADEKAEK